MSKNIISILLYFIFISNISHAQDPDYYIKKDTWVAALIASREAFMEEQKKDNLKFKLVLGSWYSVGFFPSKPDQSFDEKFPPEDDNDLNMQYDKGKYKWEIKPEWVDGTIIYFPDSFK